MNTTKTKTHRLTAYAKPCFTHRISFQEKTPKGYVDKSFDTYKDHVEWHLQQMKKSPDVIKGVSFRNI